MKRQEAHFLKQFAGVEPRKLARRERFLRKVTGRRAHMRTPFRRAHPAGSH